MEFMLIPAGYFELAPTIRKNEFNEIVETYKPKRILSKPFYIGKYEVTQEQWVAVMGGNPSKFKGRANPVENITWEDALEFIERLNTKDVIGRYKYRLPTEMEWEYAARGGQDAQYYFFMKDSELLALENELEQIKEQDAKKFARAMFSEDKRTMTRMLTESNSKKARIPGG